MSHANFLLNNINLNFTLQNYEKYCKYNHVKYHYEL